MVISIVSWGSDCAGIAKLVRGKKDLSKKRTHLHLMLSVRVRFGDAQASVSEQSDISPVGKTLALCDQLLAHSQCFDLPGCQENIVIYVQMFLTPFFFQLLWIYGKLNTIKVRPKLNFPFEPPFPHSSLHQVVDASR